LKDQFEIFCEYRQQIENLLGGEKLPPIHEWKPIYKFIIMKLSELESRVIKLEER
jgi:hypothetical protein